MLGIKRREFITILGGAAASSLPARAQERMRWIGVLVGPYSQTDREGQASIAAFLETFQRLGWTDGRNVRIEYRWGAGDAERIKASAAELVRSAPDVILVIGGSALAELHQLTSTIPIVFAQVGDPVGSGFVASLARPAGNITGFQSFDPAMGGKWLGVLKEAAPNLSRVVVLFGSDSPANVGQLRTAEALAPSLGVAVTAIDVLDGGEIERVVGTLLCIRIP
jgi:putative ABC transport system substrate-binding protein